MVIMIEKRHSDPTSYLDKAVHISHCAYALGNGMNTTIFLQIMDFLILVLQPGIEKI